MMSWNSSGSVELRLPSHIAKLDDEWRWRIPSEQLFKGQWGMFGMIGYCSRCSDINDIMGHCSEGQLGALHSLSSEE